VGNFTALLKRGYMALEDGEWAKADDFFEQVLNQDAECAEAYLGKLMAELKVKTQESLKDCDEPFDHKNNYQKVIRFGDNGLTKTLQGYVEYINTRNENERLESTYQRAVEMLNYAATEHKILETIQLFESISNYKDSMALIEKCHQKMEYIEQEAKRVREEIARKEYDQANERLSAADNIWEYKNLYKKFDSYGDYLDSQEKADYCKAKINELEEETKRRHAAFESWVRQGRCSFCGGEFKGLFSKHCSLCGKPKSY
jgi:exonuclease VII small subunit